VSEGGDEGVWGWLRDRPWWLAALLILIVVGLFGLGHDRLRRKS
jgi:hypothetical protein